MRHNFLETITGAVILLIAGLFFAFGYQFSTASHHQTIKVFARFDRVDGVAIGNDVRMGGVTIGHVNSISIDKKNFKAIVGIDIDASLKVPTDSSAEIISESLMGGKYVNLSPGGDDTFLKAGDTISLTQSSISLEGLLSKYIFSNQDKK